VQQRARALGEPDRECLDPAEPLARAVWEVLGGGRRGSPDASAMRSACRAGDLGVREDVLGITAPELDEEGAACADSRDALR